MSRIQLQLQLLTGCQIRSLAAQDQESLGAIEDRYSRLCMVLQTAVEGVGREASSRKTVHAR